MSAKSINKVLLVEDNPGDARLLREMFNEQGSSGTEVMIVRSMREAEMYLANNAVDIILLDLGLPDAQGLGAVRRAHAVAPRVPLVVLTGLDDETLAAKALQEGAQDYLVKSQIDTYGTTRGLLRALRYSIERKNLEDALFVEKERAQVTLHCIADAVICTDSSGDITFLNVVAEHLTGWLWQEATGRPIFEVFRVLGAASRETTPLPVEIAIGQDPIAHVASNRILIRRDGFKIPIEDSVAPIHDREGKATGVVIVFRDVSAARAMALQIAHSAEHDFLTGLPNRVLLYDRISQAIALAPRHKKHVAVLFLDLDGFKHINDSLGHSTGDKLLQSIATHLVDCVRSSDTVSRQGGDEFVVLLSEVEQTDDPAVTARRMLQAVAQPHSIDQHDLHITTSIGVSVYPDDGLDADTLIKNADTAMYQAKENGRQSFQFFKPAMNVRAVERQFIEEGLRRALERREFALHYQPKINLMTGAITGAEALIRWTHPTRGLVSPADFIPVAEDCGLILPIGAWVLREACEQARTWKDAGLPVTNIAVNVSAMEFRDENFLENLFAILDETNLDPRFLELELTESVLMKHAASTATILRTLRERGTRELRVIAEGVETREELAFLRAYRCEEAQGYYFSRPVPQQQFAMLLRNGIPESAIVAQRPPAMAAVGG
jgi:diguanylate cyclase (GGDEF)-like protein/PAS domain S-box-containing protein